MAQASTLLLGSERSPLRRSLHGLVFVQPQPQVRQRSVHRVRLRTQPGATRIDRAPRFESWPRLRPYVRSRLKADEAPLYAAERINGCRNVVQLARSTRSASTASFRGGNQR